MKKGFKVLSIVMTLLITLGFGMDSIAQHSFSVNGNTPPTVVVEPIEDALTTNVTTTFDGGKQVTLVFQASLDELRYNALNDAVSNSASLDWVISPVVGEKTVAFLTRNGISARELNAIFISRGFRLDKSELIENF